MIIIDKTSKKAQIVDFAVPANHRIEISQQKEIEHYQDLKRELQKLWNFKTVIVPVGALGTIPKSVIILQNHSLEAWSSKESC